MRDDVAFILSSWRSGSTLLQRMLNAHEMLLGLHELHLPFLELAPDERRWWRPLRWRVSRLARRAIEAYGVSAALAPLLHPDPIVNRAAFDRLLEAMLARHGKRTLIDKTPNYSRRAWLIDRVFPEGARRVWLVRSPGGVASSCSRTFPRHFPTLEHGLEHWFTFNDALEKSCLSGGPGAWLRVRYEELIAGEAPLREVCEFLGVPFDLGLQRFGERGGRSSLLGVSGFGDPSEKIQTGLVDDGNADRWREAGGAEAIARWLAARPDARSLAVRLGYPDALAAGEAAPAVERPETLPEPR